ncbi:MAG: bifunctional diguanylate cyclase/phosphodiesterase [Kangiellaceae bacterium]|nr:bifunctional diguanylate cyclase/phosphodiesterase [Kangiellaceae bacterium]
MVNILYNNSLAGIFVTFLAGTVLVFGFETPELNTIKLVWWSILAGLLIVRLTDFFYWRTRLQGTEFDGKWTLRRFIVGALVTAIMWSAYVLLTSQRVGVIELAFTIIIVAAMAGGSATVLASSRLAAIGYSSILLFPSSLVLILSSEHFQNLLGMLGLFFGVVMVISSDKTIKFTKNAIRLKNHNAILVEEMKKEKAEVGRINQELNQAYVKLHKINSSLEDEVFQRTEKIHQLSNLDPLTQLYNRNALTRALNGLLKESKEQDVPLAVLFIDLNGFKKINDALGHDVGDRVLKIITQRIIKEKENGNIGRWGGDEFVLALPGYTVEQAIKKAQHTIRTIEETISFDKNISLNVGASVGVAMSPMHSDDVMQLIQFADIAMYENKKSKQNMPVVFSEKLLQAAQQTEQWREGLSHAINRNELKLVYQPIISTNNSKIAGFEALLRWKFEGKQVSPIVFIPIAEQSSLIISIGAWVLRQACVDALRWSDSSDGTLSVNVSMVQLLHDEFMQTLDDVLRDTLFPPEKLLLEITESVFAESKDKVSSILKRIMERKVRVSIDDFGTGYSSLSQLQTLPFHVVKIDKTFIANIDEKGGAIIRAALYIARELGCKTVAEGIETKEQAMALNSMGVDYMQGFLYSKPKDIVELLEFIKEIDGAVRVVR